MSTPSSWPPHMARLLCLQMPFSLLATTTANRQSYLQPLAWIGQGRLTALRGFIYLCLISKMELLAWPLELQYSQATRQTGRNSMQAQGRHSSKMCQLSIWCHDQGPLVHQGTAKSRHSVCCHLPRAMHLSGSIPFHPSWIHRLTQEKTYHPSIPIWHRLCWSFLKVALCLFYDRPIFCANA